MSKVVSDLGQPLKGRILNQKMGGKVVNPVKPRKGQPSQMQKLMGVPGRVSLGSIPRGKKRFKGV